MRYKTIIFDLDGTISDPFVGISRSVNYALGKSGHDPVDPERVRPLIGPPLTEIFQHLLGPLPAPDIEELVAQYRDRYSRIGYTENTIYDDIPDVIARLAESGYALGVCTSKRADYARRIVEMFGLAPYFSFVDGGAGIDKRRQLGLLISNGLPAAAAIMIGDRAMDIVAGKTNHLAAAGVLWGFGERSELENAEPDFLFETPADMLKLLLA